MKLFHYVVLHQFTPPCIGRIEFVLKRKAGGEVLEQMDFLSVPSCFVVCAYRSRQPLLHPHTGRNLECTQKKQVFIAILWCIFKDHHYSYLVSAHWEQVTASQSSSNERNCCRFSCKLPLLQSTTNSLRWDKLLWREDRKVVKNWTLIPLAEYLFGYYLFNHMIL